ncbi:MAG: glycosyltransferase family 2 protein [Bacteroidales bacterium]|nr:glycosyltransferase family 2 protein [Bacteroidales bacterium]
MELSVVIPLYNEADGVAELVSRTTNALIQIHKEYEIIMVDDGSTDNTLALLLKIRAKNPLIKVLQLSKNFGHQAAYTAGMHEAKGKYIALMDGDLQDPPEVIVDLYDKIFSEDLDVVYGKRINPPKISRRPILTKSFHKLFKRLSGFPDMDNVGNFSIMNRRALKAILSFQESVRYLPGLRRLIGYQQGFVEYERSPRFSGTSKMRISQLLSLSSDAIFSFSKVPIKICLYLGVIGIIVFFLAGVYTLIAKLMGFALLGWSSTVLAIYFLGSIQLTFMGVIGEYVYRIYKESQKRPLYFVREFHQ